MTLLIFATFLQTLSVSLGVGSSTLAITNFFAAIADGRIDDTERRMMGIVYFVLKVAMILIFLAATSLFLIEYTRHGLTSIPVLTNVTLIVLLVIYVNAMLMTAQKIPSTFGPAIQVGSWYTLSILLSLQLLGFTAFTYEQFFLAYITWLIFCIGVVNAIMAWMKEKLKKNLGL
jgi:hypothetical protein